MVRSNDIFVQYSPPYSQATTMRRDNCFKPWVWNIFNKRGVCDYGIRAAKSDELLEGIINYIGKDISPDRPFGWKMKIKKNRMATS